VYVHITVMEGAVAGIVVYSTVLLLNQVLY